MTVGAPTPFSLPGDLWSVRPATARERLQFGRANQWAVLRNDQAVRFYATQALAQLHAALGNSASQASGEAGLLSLAQMVAATRANNRSPAR